MVPEGGSGSDARFRFNLMNVFLVPETLNPIQLGKWPFAYVGQEDHPLYTHTRDLSF